MKNVGEQSIAEDDYANSSMRGECSSGTSKRNKKPNVNTSNPHKHVVVVDTAVPAAYSIPPDACHVDIVGVPQSSVNIPSSSQFMSPLATTSHDRSPDRSCPQGDVAESEDPFYGSWDEEPTWESPESSAASLDIPKTPVERVVPVCWDHIRGRCVRDYCKFSHDENVIARFNRSADRNRKFEAAVEPTVRTMEGQLSGQPEGIFERSRSNARHSLQLSAPETTRRREPPQCAHPMTAAEIAWANAPLVPPGLGLEDKILKAQAPPRKEPPANLSLSVLDATRVTFGPGFDIQELVTGFESRQVLLKGIPRGVTSAEITNALSHLGEIVTVRLPDVHKPQGKHRDGLAVRVTFATYEEAAQAASSLDGAQLFNSPISARLLSFETASVGKGSLTDAAVLLEFPAARRTGFAGYETRELAAQALAKANGTELRGSWVTAEFFEGLPNIGAYNLRFHGLPPDAKAKDIDLYGANDGVMMELPNYQSQKGAINRLRETLSEIAELESFNVLPPPYKRGVVRAWAHFTSTTSADIVCAALHNRKKRFCGFGKLYARHVRTLSYNLPRHVYEALSSDLRFLSAYVWDNENDSSITVLDRRRGTGPSPPVKVKLGSTNMRALTRMKVAFEKLLRGDIITQNGEFLWDGFFARRGGILYLEDLEKRYPGIIIHRDPRRRRLALFGPAAKRGMVRSAILARVASLRAQKTYILPLQGRMIGLFMSADLARLQRELGAENVKLDLWERVLTVRGDDEAYKVAQQAIKRARDRHTGERQHHEVECPVCFDEVTSPVSLACGHTWCKTCLANYLMASVDNKVFPLTCLGNEARCTHAIPLNVAQEVLSPNDFSSVIHAAFLAYVNSRPNEFHYCPTPDCPQVYRKGSRNTVLQCPSCLTRICPHCHVEYHEGSRCQDKEDAEDERLFEEWKKNHDVKECPSCRAPIEKLAGCNHMTCAHCRTHICWVCLETFTMSETVYDHMRSAHGGIGLG